MTGLTGMAALDGLLYVARWSDVLVLKALGEFPPRGFEVQEILRHSFFNDIHHLEATQDGTLLVASCGTETVVELDASGKEIGAWSATEGSALAQSAAIRCTDFSKYTSTKPHALHMNTAVRHPQTRDLYLTLCNAGKVVKLAESGGSMATVAEGLSMPHDGKFVNDYRHFIVTSAKSLELHMFEVNDDAFAEIVRVKCPGDNTGQGWLRGIAQVDPFRFLVGLSVNKHSATLQDAMLYEVDMLQGRVTKTWTLPRLGPWPVRQPKGRLWRVAEALHGLCSHPFFPNPNLYTMLPWSALSPQAVAYGVTGDG